MDKLLHDLHNTSSDLSIQALVAAHADDVRTCDLSIESIKVHAACLDTFTSSNSLKVNNAKTEIVHVSVTIKKEAKCLGVWTFPLIHQSRRIGFALSSTSGFLICSKSVLYVRPTCSPIWLRDMVSDCLTDPLLITLDRFQAEIGKRILKLPRSHTNICKLYIGPALKP